MRNCSRLLLKSSKIADPDWSAVKPAPIRIESEPEVSKSIIVKYPWRVVN